MAFPRVFPYPGVISRYVVSLFLLAGCGGSGEVESPRSDSREVAAPMPVALNVDGEPEISIGTLRRELGANSQAQFTKAGGKILAASLMYSGVTNIEPLRGLPLKFLDLTQLPISDLAPLAGMPLNELYLEGTQVTDLTPLKGMPLRVLRMEHIPVSDLTPLAGMRLEQLNVYDTQVQDIAVVADMPLNTLWLSGSKVSDLTPIRQVSLESLDVENTPVSDLSPLAGKQSLKRLNIAGSAVTDLTPLQGLRLERLIFTPGKITRGLEIVRGMTSLQNIGPSFDEVQPPDEFWAGWDARPPGSPSDPPVTPE